MVLNSHSNITRLGFSREGCERVGRCSMTMEGVMALAEVVGTIRGLETLTIRTGR